MKKKITILGATGSIGVNALNVIEKNADEFEVFAISGHSNLKLLADEANKFNPEYIVISDDSRENKSVFEQLEWPETTEVLWGEKGINDIAQMGESDIILNSIVGSAGLMPTYLALKSRKTVALANKESIIMGGELLKNVLYEYGGKVLPVDSEHSAIFQLLLGKKREEVSKLILTASGGAFLELDKNELSNVKVSDALKHPTWNMGNKITIDSATMVNKGFEVIEAHWLFDFSYDDIKVVIHPQSIIHSMIEFVDGSLFAQMGVPDMALPIQFAFTYPKRSAKYYKKFNFDYTLTFFDVDIEKYPAFDLTILAGKKGGSAPIILNAANEESVYLFLNEKINFLQIADLINVALDKFSYVECESIEEIMDLDKKVKRFVYEKVYNK